MKPALCAAVAFALIAGAPSPADAQPSGAPPGAPAASAAEPLRVRLDLGDAALDPAALEADIERELRQPISVVAGEPAPLNIRIREKNRLILTYDDPRSGKLERTVDLPQDPKRASEVVALLVGNVVRDEAAELLRSLEPSPPPADTTETPAADAEAEPAPPAPPPEVKPAPEAKKKRKPWPGLRSRFDELTDGPVKLNASLFYPIALLSDSDRRVLNLEVGLFYSRVGAIEGVGVNLGAMFVEKHVRGVTVGPFWQQVGGATRGVTTSLIYDGGSGPLTGASVAGIISNHPADVRGVQAAAVMTNGGAVQGAQASAAINISKSLEGAAAAAGVNLVSGPVTGVVAAAGANTMTSLRGVSAAAGANVTGDVEGAMLSGGVNVARHVRGLSIGLINVADRVDGIQLGLVNVAREVNGASLGLVSVVGNGKIQPIFYATNLMPAHLGLRFIAGYAYSELGAGFDPADDRQALEGGGGVHLPLGRTLYLEPGVHYSEIQSTKNVTADEHGELQYRLRAGVRLFDLFDVIGGGGAAQRLSGQGGDALRFEALLGVALL